MFQLFGLAVPYNVPSKPFSENIRERFLPGAFSRSLNGKGDLYALSHHDRKYILGRRSSGTLKVTEDGAGVWFSVIPPDALWANGLIHQIQRGDITDVSFLFGPWDENDDPSFFTEEGGEKIINHKTARLYEISIVTYGIHRGHVSVKEAGNGEM